MSERYLRLILVSAMFLALLLGSNWLGIVWYSMEGIATVIRLSSIGSVGEIVVLLGDILFWLTVPILILLNVFLIVFPIRRLKRCYRIFLLVLFPLTWYGIFQLDPVWREEWFWAIPVVVTAAALMEIAFVISEDLNKPQSGVYSNADTSNAGR